MNYRPLCAACNKKPAAINYTRNNKTYYRNRCDSCIRKKRNIPAPIPQWVKVGYKKKTVCERCGFKAKYKEQMFVYHIDGNLNNTALSNLKTVCANCQIEIAKEGLGWRQGDLVPDF
jgi:hypothetical protein